MSGLLTTDTVFVVDCSSYIHRDYHAAKLKDPVYNVNSRGEPTGALKQFTERLFWWRQRGANGRFPTHAACVFDAGRRNFRHDLFPAYKANRPEIDDDLKRQMPLMRDAVEALGMCAVERSDTKPTT